MKYPQPDRDLLNKHMLLCKNYIAGDVVDVGGGNNRYQKYFNYSSWTNANLKKDHAVDIAIDLNLKNNIHDKFDTVICNQVLGDVKNPQFSINELGRLLKNNGYLIITESLLNEEHDAPYDYYRFTEYGIKELLNSSKFDYQIIMFDKRGKFFSVIFQLLNRMLINRLNINDTSSKFIRKVFSLCLLLSVKLASTLDLMIKHKSYESFYLGWIIVARKLD